MSKHLAEVKAYLNELRKMRAAYTREAPSLISDIYQTNDIKPEVDFFKESSFLYLRSYHADIGDRPFSGITFWNSPDINISPITNIGSYTTELEAGKTYNISCRLHNRGDLIIPYPKVEFFLTDPTLGFNTTVAKYLGVTQLSSLLMPGSNDEAKFLYTVPVSEAGHKCLFARTYSFSPLDKPFDLISLNPRLDRHIGQKNLNFIPQLTPYSFNLVHQPNAMERIEFRPLSKNAVLALQHPALLDVKVKNLRKSKQLRKIEIKAVADTEHRFSLKRRKNIWEISSEGKGPNLDTQATINKRMEAIVEKVYSGNASFADFKKDLRQFREINRAATLTPLRITIPDFGLNHGEAVGFEIVNTNQVTGQIKGGITIIATQSAD